MTVTTFPAPSRAEDSAGIVAWNLKRLMTERGVPQRAIADALGITQSNVSKRLKGKTPFTTDDLDKLARAFEIHPSVLLSDAAQTWNAPAAVRSEGVELPRMDSNHQPAGLSGYKFESTFGAEILPLIKQLPAGPALPPNVIPLPTCAPARTGSPVLVQVTGRDRAA